MIYLFIIWHLHLKVFKQLSKDFKNSLINSILFKSNVTFNFSFSYLTILLLIFICSIVNSSERRNVYSPFSPGVLLNVSGNSPALLSIAEAPYASLQTILPFSISFTFRNDKFITPSPASLLTAAKKPGTWVAHLLTESFDLSGLSPNQVSQRLTEKLENGINFFTTINLPLIKIARNMSHDTYSLGWGLSVVPHIKGSIHLPGSFFSLIFSSTSGLQSGNTLIFKDLNAHMEISTDFRTSLGQKFQRNFTLFNRYPFKMAWGAEILYKMGHSLFEFKTHQGKISFSRSNVLTINGHSTITTSGIGLQNNSSPSNKGFPLNGNGLGISGGLAFYNDKMAFLLNILDFGFMKWKTGLQQSNIIINSDSLYLLNILDNSQESIIEFGKFNRTKKMVKSLETMITFDWSLRSQVRHNSLPAFKEISAYRILSAGVIQPLYKQVGLKRKPTFIFTLENGFFDGTMPLRLGWTFKDKQNFSSYVEIIQISKGPTFSIWYRAISDFVFRWRRGGEIGIKSHFFWDM